jgi:hypothetical protein
MGGAGDDDGLRSFRTTVQIRPEWEQSAARRVLGVEPVVITGARPCEHRHNGSVCSLRALVSGALTSSIRL